MSTGNRKYYDRDARPSRSRDTDDESIHTRELITYNDMPFIILDEVSDDGETVWNKLEDIGNITEQIRSSRHANIGEVDLTKTKKELDIGKYNNCREASISTESARYTNPKEIGSMKRRYNQCEKANDKSEDFSNYTIDISGPKRKPFDNRVVHYFENISANCHQRDSHSQNPIIVNTLCFPDSPDRSSETYSKRDGRNEPHTSHKRKQTSDIHSYPLFHERQVQFEDHTESKFTQTGEGNPINRNDYELSIQTQTALTENSTAMDWQYSNVSNLSKKSPHAYFQYSDKRTFQNNGSSDRNILYNDRGSIKIEHQSEHYNQEIDIIRDGKFENDTKFQKEMSGNRIHVNPNFIFPGKTLQDGLHVQNRNCQVNGYFDTNNVPMTGHIQQFNTYDNFTNLLTNSTDANIVVELKESVSNDIAKSASTHSHKDIVTHVYRTLVQMRKTNLTPADVIDIMKQSGELQVGFETEDDLVLLLDKYKDKFAIEVGFGGQCIFTRTNVQLCQMHTNNHTRKERCMNLHICKYFLLGTCYMPDCKFSHKLFSSHNRNVLREHDLDMLDQESIKVLMKGLGSRNLSTTPLICTFYNNKGGCQKGTLCMHLHVCNDFINDYCKFGDICKRAHDLNDPQPKEVLKRHGLISEGRSYDNMVIDLIKATLQVGEVKLNRNMAVFEKDDSKQSEINEQSYHSKEYKTHAINVQAHDDEKYEVDLSRQSEYIPLEVDIRLISSTGETCHASPHNIQTTDSVSEQVIASCADIARSNATTENTKEGTMIENISKSISNNLQAVIEYPKTGKNADSISPDRWPLPTWTPLIYERKDITFNINKADEDFEDKSNQHVGDQNDLTTWNGKSATETLFQDVGGELTGIRIQEINSNPTNVSRIMQRSDTVVADTSVERQDFENDDKHEIQARRNIQTHIACTDTEKHKPDHEKYHGSSAIQLCIINQTTMEEEGNAETPEKESVNVNIVDTAKHIPSALNTAVAFEMADEGDCYHLRRLNCMWQLKDTCGIWKDTECTESGMLDALHAKFTARRKKSRGETKHPATY